MKKRNILNLIRYYAENNDTGFRSEAYFIASYFDSTGDHQLAEYIMALLSDANTFIPQTEDGEFALFEKLSSQTDALLLPYVITQDLLGLVNAVSRNAGVSKFLFRGSPGTGKTEAVKHLARILDREIFMVDFAAVIDSKLGQTQKNITELFREMNNFSKPDKVIVLFDEIDALAMERRTANDLREMGRATSAMLKGMDYMKEDVVLIATTNLYNHFDKALIRRFDSIISFDRYTQEDLMCVAEKLLDKFLSRFKLAGRDVRLFRKIIKQNVSLPYPGELKNIIKTSVAFSNADDNTDYFRRLYQIICDEHPTDVHKLNAQGFSTREIEMLTAKSKSSVSRELKGAAEDE
jgi:SpoVK/Ycf46/Vps4 family AAA+-type ATPase